MSQAQPLSSRLPAEAGTATLGGTRAVAYAPGMTAKADDSALMLRYGDGDTQAFEVLYRRHNDPLYRYLLRLSGNRETAADLFQDVWGKVIGARLRYRPTAKFTTWLYRIAHNAFVDHLRRNRRYDGGESDAAELAAATEGPDDAAGRLQLRDCLLRALEQLPPEQRDAYLLQAEAGLSVDQVAAVTGVNPETAKSRLRYATGKLKQSLAANLVHREPAT